MSRFLVLAAFVFSLALAQPGRAAGIAAAELAATASEQDYFADLPRVLSVSRLAQPVDETPGAVTIIDRETIRLSGARNVAELMRLVPGFQVSDSFESIGPLVAYHGGFSDLSYHIQVLIDGRSVYASYVRGSGMPGLQSVALEDIERIEVLRGSNSAAYGARAFLGVINIVTRDPAAVASFYAAKTNGADGIDDNFVRAAWSHDGDAFRASVGRRADDGLEGNSSGNRVGYFNLAATLNRIAGSELALRAGASDQDAGVGFAGTAGNQPRVRHIGLDYLQADLKRALEGKDADLALSFSHTDEHYADHFALGAQRFALFNGTRVDSGGVAQTDTLSAQHSFRADDSVRLVWGGELRREGIQSRPFYNTDAWMWTDFWRLFANVEWRLGSTLLLNAGSMYEHSSLAGRSIAPRATLNWHFSDDQTLRVGATKGYRPPSMYERMADVRFATVPPSAIYGVTDQARGGVQSESIVAHEIGYLGNLRRFNLSADLRFFRERFDGPVQRQRYILTDPYAVSNVPCFSGVAAFCAADFVNGPGFMIHGYEGQLQWRPLPGSRLLLTHAQLHVDADDPNIAASAPESTDSIALFQALPGDVDLSVQWQRADLQPWLGGVSATGMHRTDVRLGKAFRLAGNRCEISLVVQNLGQPYSDFDPAFHFRRRAFVNLSLEM